MLKGDLLILCSKIISSSMTADSSQEVFLHSKLGFWTTCVRIVKGAQRNGSASISNPPHLIKERLGIHLNLRFERGNFFEEDQSLVTFVLHSSRQGERLFSLSLTSSENFAWVLWNWRNITAGWWFLKKKKII